MSEVFWYFFKLGWLAFGGPVGQIGLMHLHVVERAKWLSEDEFVRALNFCHALPGPEAMQLAIYIGYKKQGIKGGIVAGLLFLCPGYLTLTFLGWIYVHYGNTPQVLGMLWGFRPVGLALLLSALLRISRAALKSVFQAALAVAAFVAFHVLGLPYIPLLVGCGLVFIFWRRLPWAAAALAALWPARADAATNRLVEISWFFLKVGLFSFGGAYAALPLMREGSVSTYGWITDRQMIDALALGETTPGPLISIGIFIGYLAGRGPGAALATFWLFLPSFVFVLAAAPHMDALTRRPAVKEFLKGVTAGVVGLMFSVSIPLAQVAFVDFTSAALGVAAFLVLVFWKWRLNVVVVVLGGGVLGLARAFGLF